MNKIDLIERLNNDFDVYRRRDLWHRFSSFWEPVYRNLTPLFKEYYSGLMFDFADEIQEVITAVFISENLLRHIADAKKENVLIFTHHPLYQNQHDYTWSSFYSEYIDMLTRQRISIYSCHLPLDLHPRFSTDYYFAKQLIEENIGRLTAFDSYFSEEMSIGYYGYCKANLDEILLRIKPDHGHYMFSDRQPSIIACSPGGGGALEYISKAKDLGVDTYITGVCVHKGNHAVGRIADFFSEIRKLEINLIELSHYSTESFVMKALPNDYFARLPCACSFFDEEACIIQNSTE